MNFRILRLIVSLLLIVAFVLGATIVESSYSLDPNAWLFAQRKVELLWVVDCFAVLTLLPVFGIASVQNRLAARGQEIAMAREEHQKQLDRMVRSAEQMDLLNAAQSDQIAQLEQVTTDLQRKVEASQSEMSALLERLQAETRTKLDLLETATHENQKILATEARRLADVAFVHLNEQMETTTRQMEAVNLAMQYQRAEIKQLRQSIRALQQPHEFFEIAHLSPAELAALNSEEANHLLNVTYYNQQITDLPQGAIPSAVSGQQSGQNEVSSDETLSDLSMVSLTEDTGFFVPTINSQSTFISPPTAFAVASPYLDQFELEPLPFEVEGHSCQLQPSSEAPCRPHALPAADGPNVETEEVNLEETRAMMFTSTVSEEASAEAIGRNHTVVPPADPESANSLARDPSGQNMNPTTPLRPMGVTNEEYHLLTRSLGTGVAAANPTESNPAVASNVVAPPPRPSLWKMRF